MSRLTAKLCALVVLTLFCVSELASTRLSPSLAAGDVATAKKAEEPGGEENPTGDLAIDTSRIDLDGLVDYGVRCEAASFAPALALTSHQLRGPPAAAA